MRNHLEQWFVTKPRFREFLTKLVYGSKDRKVTLFSSDFEINSLRENGYLRASRKVAASSLLRDEAAVIMNLSHFIRPDGAFIDAGANIGIYSVIFSKFRNLYPRFEVHSFEVHPDTYARLKTNAEIHHFSAYQCGLSNAEQTLEFISGAVSHVTTLKSRANAYSKKGGDSFKVPCQPLANFPIESNNIILKVDVEGQELEVLQGAEDLFNRNQILCVYVDGYKDKGVLEFLSSHNFSFWDGRTMKKSDGDIFSLLAIRDDAARDAAANARQFSA